MGYRIKRVETLTAGTTAKDVAVNYRFFLLQNLSDAATVYIKEKADDKKAATAANGFAIKPGVTLDAVLTAETLSVVASAASTDVRLLFLDIG